MQYVYKYVNASNRMKKGTNCVLSGIQHLFIISLNTTQICISLQIVVLWELITTHTKPTALAYFQHAFGAVIEREMKFGAKQ